MGPYAWAAQHELPPSMAGQSVKEYQKRSSVIVILSLLTHSLVVGNRSQLHCTHSLGIAPRSDCDTSNLTISDTFIRSNFNI